MKTLNAKVGVFLLLVSVFVEEHSSLSTNRPLEEDGDSQNAKYPTITHIFDWIGDIHRFNKQQTSKSIQIMTKMNQMEEAQQEFRTSLTEEMAGNTEEIKQIKDEVQNVENQLSTQMQDLNNRTNAILLQINSKIQNPSTLQQTIQNTVGNSLLSNNPQIKTYVENSMKNEIQKMEVNLKSYVTGLQQQIDLSVQNSRPHFGRSISLLETNKSRDDQDGGCGGILVAEKGYIAYHPDTTTNLSSSFRCIWTVRANLYEKVVFRLINGDVGSNTKTTLSLTPLQAMLSSSALSSRFSTTITSKNEYVMNGPVVFVTFISNPSSSLPPPFRLYYEGRGNNTATKQYRHYHSVESQGAIDYPKIRDASQYSSNEVATFVIAPHHSKFYLQLKYIDIEAENSCEYDALSIFMSQSTNYILNADTNVAKSFRYCSKNTTIRNQVHGNVPRDAFIVTFKSDGSNVNSGFKFSWQ